MNITPKMVPESRIREIQMHEEHGWEITRLLLQALAFKDQALYQARAEWSEERKRSLEAEDIIKQLSEPHFEGDGTPERANAWMGDRMELARQDAVKSANEASNLRDKIHTIQKALEEKAEEASILRRQRNYAEDKLKYLGQMVPSFYTISEDDPLQWSPEWESAKVKGEDPESPPRHALVELPQVVSTNVKNHRVYLQYPSRERWFDDDTIDGACQKMADYLDDLGIPREDIERFVRQAGGDPEELTW